MADLYFIPTIAYDEFDWEHDWNESANWFFDSAGTNPANRIPNNSDSVILDGSLVNDIKIINTGNRHLSLTNLSLNGVYLEITNISDSLTISNLLTVTNSAYALSTWGDITTNQFIFDNLGGSGGSITGNGYITGDTAFEAVSINGDLYIDNISSILQVNITGNIIFNNINPSYTESVSIVTEDINLTYSATGDNKIITVNDASRLSIYNVPLIGMRVVGSGIPLEAKILSIDGNNVTLDCDSNIPATNNESVTFKGTIIFDNSSYSTASSGGVSVNGNTILINGSNLNGNFSGFVDVYDTSSLAGGDVGVGNNSTINFYDYSILVGDCYLGASNARINFYDNSVNTAQYIFGGGGSGDLYFYNDSYNNGYIINSINSVSFNDNTYNITFITSGSLNFNGFTGTNVDGTFIGGSRIYYFSGNADSEWSNSDNWFYFYDGETFSGPVWELPDADGNISSTVYIYASITYADGSPTVYNLNFIPGFPGTIALNITVLNEAIINGVFGDYDENAYNISGDNITFAGPHIAGLAANCTITTNSETFIEFDNSEGGGKFNRGYISGSAIFKQGAIQEGEIQYDAEFYDSSFNCGQGCSSYGTNPGLIHGNAEFYDNSVNLNGTIDGLATFYDGSENQGTVNNAIFYGTSQNDGGTINNNADFYENSSNNSIYIYGSAVFYDYSQNYESITSATFYDFATNNGYISYGVFYDNSENGTNMSGADFYNYSSNNGELSSTSSFNNYAINNGILSAGDTTYTFNNFAVNSEYGTSTANTLIFNDESINLSNGGAKAYWVYINGKPIAVPLVLSSDSSSNNCDFDYGYFICPVFSRAGLGVNGSNILGIL